MTEAKELSPEAKRALRDLSVNGQAAARALDTVGLDEAIAIYLYLVQRPTGGRTADEDRAYRWAWQMICAYGAGAVVSLARG